MSDLDQASDPLDGRAARRQRNIDAVLEKVIEMFAEDAMFPSMEQVATRSGLSLRSLYRYFADPGELVDAAIKHSMNKASAIARLHAIGEGPLDQRIDAFVKMRLALYDAMGPSYRAGTANAERHSRIREERARNRAQLLEQFERQFAPELVGRTPANRRSVVAAGDWLTQLDSIDFLRGHRQFTAAETRRTLIDSLAALLAP